MKSKRRRILIVVLLVLYVLTWIGGWTTYSRDHHQHAQELWTQGRQRNAEKATFAASQSAQPDLIDIFPQPSAKVDWCVPLLPGVLLADSSYVIAPLWGEGGLKLVIYYGVGTIEFPIHNWRA